MRRKTRALLAYLAVAQRPYSRHELAALFCQEADNPLRALRHLLSRLRAALGPTVLEETGETIRLDTTRIWIDAARFTQVLEANFSELPQINLSETIALYQGEFLAGLHLPDAPEFELWLLGYRAHLHRLYERAALTLLDLYQTHTQSDNAITLAQQLISHNPLLEEAHYRLVLLYARTNQRAAALNQYEQCRRLLADELAVEPMSVLVTLHADIMIGRLKPASPPPTMLDVPGWSVAADFVGRESELAQLRWAWTATQQGQNRIILVTAEAGGGKTRLIQESFGFLIPDVFLVGQCYESTHALAYQPWTQLLGSFLHHLDETYWRTLPDHWLGELAQLLPALAAKRPFLTPVGKPEQLFAAVVALLRLAERPLLLFLDDLQWADAASLQLLHYVSEHVPTPLLLIGAYRPEEIEDNPALLTLLRDWSRHHQVTHLSLPPLSSADVEQILTQLWSQLPPGHYIPQLRDQLHQTTRGNPLFIGEIVRQLTISTHLPEELPVPTSLRDLIQRRLHQLPGSGRQVLESLAVLEQPASLDLVQQICARSEEEMLQALEAGLRWRLLRTDEASHNVEFSHDLMRQAIGEQLNPLRRQLLHRRTAVALFRQGAKAATLAHHWHLAGDTEQEAVYVAQAGEEATAVYAHQEAIRCFQRALELLPKTAHRLEIMCNLADVWMMTGKWSEAETMYQQALSNAQKQAHLPLQARCQTSLGKLMARKGHYREALDWLEQARISHTALGNLKGAAQNVGTMGIVHWQLDEYDQALACYEHALQKDKELDDQAGMALWIGNMASVYHQQKDYEQALMGYQQALQIHLKLGKKVEAGICLGNLGNTWRDKGDYQQAITCYEQALQYRHEAGDESGMAYAVINVGTLYAQMGIYSLALTCYRRALQIDLKLGQRQNMADDLGQMADVYLSEGSYELAQKLLDRSIPSFRMLGGKYGLCQQLLTQASVLSECGQYAQAQFFCQESKAMAEGIHPDTYFSASLLSIRLNVALGQLTDKAGIEALKLLLTEATEDKEQVAILYEIWRVDKNLEEVRQKTAELYRHLYTHTPHIIYHRRYQELTGQILPAPSLIPKLPAIITDSSVDLDALLLQVDHLLSANEP